MIGETASRDRSAREERLEFFHVTLQMAGTRAARTDCINCRNCIRPSGLFYDRSNTAVCGNCKRIVVARFTVAVRWKANERN